jgi:coenzyme Q-binding protein COQ10
MFNLVADVERYPEFVPLLRKARVVGRFDGGYETEQTLALGPLAHSFRTRTQLDRPHSIVVTSDDRSFCLFDVRWSFAPTAERCCRIDFSLECEPRSIWLRPIGDVLVGQMALSMVQAFATRARHLSRDHERLNVRDPRLQTHVPASARSMGES